MSIEIIYASEEYSQSFYETLSQVAKERVYLEMIEPPPFEKITSFQKKLIDMKGPVYYAIDKNRVIGWCAVFPEENPRKAHRASLVMGLIPKFRGQGIGSRLIDLTLDHARSYGLEKIELHVFTTNISAIALYKKFGFEQEGLIKKFRKLDGQYFDCLVMGKIL
jgi:RimJ/RimL family protein N-acetyltransferase